MSEKENKGKLNIELPEEVATGVYANLADTHSPAEFVMDFIQVMPGMPKAKVRGRVVMSPHHVKRLPALLKMCSGLKTAWSHSRSWIG